MEAVEFEGETVVPRPLFAGFLPVLEAHLAAAGDGGLAQIDDEGASLELAGPGADLLEHEPAQFGGDGGFRGGLGMAQGDEDLVIALRQRDREKEGFVAGDGMARMVVRAIHELKLGAGFKSKTRLVGIDHSGRDLGPARSRRRTEGKSIEGFLLLRQAPRCRFLSGATGQPSDCQAEDGGADDMRAKEHGRRQIFTWEMAPRRFLRSQIAPCLFLLR